MRPEGCSGAPDLRKFHTGGNVLRSLDPRRLTVTAACLLLLSLPLAGCDDEDEAAPVGSRGAGASYARSSATGLAFYLPGAAIFVDQTYALMRDAAAACDRQSYDNGVTSLADVIDRSQQAPLKDSYLSAVEQERDTLNFRVALQRKPPFPDPCTPAANPPRPGDRGAAASGHRETRCVRCGQLATWLNQAIDANRVGVKAYSTALDDCEKRMCSALTR